MGNAELQWVFTAQILLNREWALLTGHSCIHVTMNIEVQVHIVFLRGTTEKKMDYSNNNRYMVQ